MCAYPVPALGLPALTQKLQDEGGAQCTWERGWVEPGGSPAHWWAQTCLWHLGSVSFSGVWLGRVAGDGQKGSGISPTWSGRPRGVRISGWFAGPSAERQVHLWLGGGAGRAGVPCGTSLADTAARGTLTQLFWDGPG